MKRDISMISGIIGCEDFHIHPRPDYSNTDVVMAYINELRKKKIRNIGFVEHGVRKSNKHKSILNNEKTINDYTRKIHSIITPEDVNVWAGIEADYLGINGFAEEYINMAYSSDIDYIIGSVHGKYSDYNAYLEDTIAMLENYKINILGHFRIVDDIWNYKNVGRVIELLKQKQIIYEVNIAPRYDASQSAKKYVYDLISSNNLRISVGSDAHSIDDIGINYNNLAWMDIINS